MIKTKTVFILGAGASWPYGYPLGEELGEEICSNFVHDCKSWGQAIGRQPAPVDSDLRVVQEFVKKFDRSHTESIDLFLARNPEFRRLGKLAIIFRILAAEGESNFGRHCQHQDLDWYIWLFKELTNELLKKNDYGRFHENNVAFITFNYDRSLEFFLYTSLVNSFNRIEPEKIIEQLNQIRIIHVFGQVAPLEWQDAQRGLHYKRPLHLINVDALIEGLRIVYEESENLELVEVQQLISGADWVFFLGFGYAKENLDILGIPEVLNRNQHIYGTALGFTQREINNVRSILQGTADSDSKGGAVNVNIENLDCRALLRKYL